jgi:hypothetical protein
LVATRPGSLKLELVNTQLGDRGDQTRGVDLTE